MFSDRPDAGRRLARLLEDRTFVDPIVLALPRGGVPVAAEVATRIGADLDVLVARKVGAPGRPELGVGAIAEGGGTVIDRGVVRALGITDAALAVGLADATTEMERRVQAYRGDRPFPELAGRDVVVIDDGMATGVTAEAAIRSVRVHNPRSVVLAVPVCAPPTASRLKKLCDAVVCASAPADFFAVGVWYDDFHQNTDEEVGAILRRARADGGRRAG